MHNNRISELKKRVDEQCKSLSSLASSLEGEDMLGDLRCGAGMEVLVEKSSAQVSF